MEQEQTTRTTLLSPPAEFFEHVRDGRVHTVQAFLEKHMPPQDNNSEQKRQMNLNAQFVPQNLDNYELKGLTPIHISALRLNQDMVQTLLSYGSSFSVSRLSSIAFFVLSVLIVLADLLSPFFFHQALQSIRLQPTAPQLFTCLFPRCDTRNPKD
jgi:hypothetical protein